MSEPNIEREILAAVHLRNALCEMAAVLGDGMTASGVGGSFTCSEAETLAEVLVLSGHAKEAASFLAGHAEGDDDAEGTHHGLDEDAMKRFVLLRWGAVIA